MYPDETRCHLEEILSHARLVSLLQPVLDLAEGRVAGYEALSRGPSKSPLHAPQTMSRAAEHHGLLAALDWQRVRTAIRAFGLLKLSGRLFVNLSAGSLLDPGFAPEVLHDTLKEAGLDRSQLVFEITGNSAASYSADLIQAASRLHAAGFEMALDERREGVSSLHLWSEIKPVYVRIGRDFIADIHQDPHRVQFVCVMRHLAEEALSCVMAEGVESPVELVVLKDLGVRYAQGHLIGNPSPVPIRLLPRDVEACLQSHRAAGTPWHRQVTPPTDLPAGW
jgi:EAL domain-containing protein (putative c-di-GMP-specific phosphodiesterase class I)